MSQMVGVLAGGAILFFMVIFLLIFAFCVLLIIAQWKLFKKAGQPGWAAIIPFYNAYVLTKLTWGNGWLFLLSILPIGNIVFSVFTCIKLARVFGKGAGYAVGLIFLPVIFIPMLAFGNSVYLGPDQGSNKGPIIACAVLGGIGVLLYGAVIVLSVAAGVKSIDQTDPVYIEDNYDDFGLDDFEDSDDYDYDEYDYDDDYSSESDVAATPIEGYDFFVNITLDDGETQISVPVVNSEYLTVSGAVATGSSDGVSSSLYIGYMYSDIPQMVGDAVADTCEMYEEMPEYYADITVDEMITGDGFALQQINYNYISWDGEKYPCIEIIKCDQVNDDIVMMHLTVDNSSATQNTQAVFAEACELYGIDFDFD